MNKKAFVANTIIFIISAIAVYISVKHLGNDNLMVGITCIFLLVAIVNKDFSRTPIRSILKISFLTAFIAFAPYLVNLNIYSGFFINFIVVFVMIYLVVYTLNKTIYFPFIFGYTLLLETNVTGRDLSLRVLGLVTVGVIAVIFQIIFTKLTTNKNDKNKILLEIISSLIENINNFKTGNFDFYKSEKTKELSTYWSREILEKRNNSYYLKEVENIELNLIATIEKLTLVIEFIANNKEKNQYYEELLIHLEKSLITLETLIREKGNSSEFGLAVNEINEIYSELKFKDIKIYEAIEALNIIDNLVVELLEKEKKDYIEIKFGLKEIKEIKKLLIADFNKNSVRFIFAFRTAFLIAFAYFISQYFHLELGKWMVFTITSVSQPYNDTVRGRAKGRFYGTLVGVAIYLPLSYIFTTVESRVVIIAIAVYFMISFKKYAYSISMLTVLFLGVVTIRVPNILLFAWDRIFFVALGIILVLIGNKIIFPYSLEKETKILLKKYYKICDEILEKTLLLYKQEGVREEIRILILTAKGIENKILINNTALDSDKLREFRNEARRLLTNIHNVLNRVEYLNKELKRSGYERMGKIQLMKNEIEKNYKGENLDYILEKYSKSVEKISEKLIYIDVYEMVISRNKLVLMLSELAVETTLEK